MFRPACVGFTLLLAIACSPNNVASMSCDDVEEEAVQIPAGALRLLKITGGKEESRASTSVVCRGKGIFSTGEEVQTRYTAYIDEDGEIMIKWDTNEAARAAYNAAVQEVDRQLEAATSEAEREAEETLAEFQRQTGQ